VPAWTADCYFFTSVGKQPNIIHNDLHFDLKSKATPKPCWSVGRLIEIYEICFGGYFGYRYFRHTLMEDVLLKIEEQIDSIDFSKLEE
jgi:hypothetical protein